MTAQGDDATASHPTHDGLRSQALDHWTCRICDEAYEDMSEDEADAILLSLWAAHPDVVDGVVAVAEIASPGAGYVRLLREVDAVLYPSVLVGRGRIRDLFPDEGA